MGRVRTVSNRRCSRKSCRPHVPNPAAATSANRERPLVSCYSTTAASPFAMSRLRSIRFGRAWMSPTKVPWQPAWILRRCTLNPWRFQCGLCLGIREPARRTSILHRLPLPSLLCTQVCEHSVLRRDRRTTTPASKPARIHLLVDRRPNVLRCDRKSRLRLAPPCMAQ